ncbi:MAG: cell division protein FtsA [Pelagibacteraceae bacterium]|jgi:cell division protein FtsA|nr:cell division protein FtsA [Pelagibacteraceae bacterium]HJO13362.1 cell division protein FtsA [Alphaproteobacteria bacterium]MBO6466511.1 cell division protein FtsA [Pelagibacteraceae bacterium]MBO6467405.1 cell division protein FtsA [Pelagibacteraceae bacterium]MBO6468990.1 cell division protein FtsA [Pelagibacteraceae bacterium]
MIKVGIDIGNSKISSIVCDIKTDGSKKILSFISNSNTYVNKSMVTNLVSLKDEIHKTISEAAKESQTDIKSVNLNLPAIESSSIFSESVINVSGKMISDLHLKKAVNQSDILDVIENYDVIQKFISSYEIDNKFFSNSPIGTFGDNLKLNFYKFAVKKNYTNTLSTLFKNLNIHIENYVPTPLSSSLATLTPDDKLLGAICIDLGASSTSIALFENEKLIFMDAINVGGKNITNDIARGVSTNVESAERLKTLYGSVISSPSDEYELIEIPMSNEPSKFKQINRSTINSIIKPRAEETLELIWQKLKEYNFHKKHIRNLILTGGGAILEGIDEYARDIFDSNVRIGMPLSIKGLDNKFINPQFSQTIGTILFNKSDFEIEFLRNEEKYKKNTVLSRFSSWLDQYI